MMSTPVQSSHDRHHFFNDNRFASSVQNITSSVNGFRLEQNKWIQNTIDDRIETTCEPMFALVAPKSGTSATSSARLVHTSAALCGKKNFRKFPIPNKRGQFEHNKLPEPLLNKEFDYPVFRDTLLVRYPGFWFGRKLFYVKEMEPELIVPDLTGFELKPYVSYRTPNITQSEFTARDLFNATIADNIIEKFKNNETIDVDVSDQEVERARIRAKQTGADLFIDKSDFGIQ